MNISRYLYKKWRDYQVTKWTVLICWRAIKHGSHGIPLSDCPMTILRVYRSLAADEVIWEYEDDSRVAADLYQLRIGILLSTRREIKHRKTLRTNT